MGLPVVTSTCRSFSVSLSATWSPLKGDEQFLVCFTERRSSLIARRSPGSVKGGNGRSLYDV